MLFPLLFFISSIFAGLAILEIFQVNSSSFLKLILAIILGTVVNTLIIFWSTLFFGLNFAIILVILILTFFIPLIFLLKRVALSVFFGNINFEKNPVIVGGLLIAALYIILIFAKSLIISPTGITAGNRLVWTDWPIHFAIISSFTKGDNFPPQNPLFAGQPISYPFFADFLSAILQVLGADFKTAVVLPGVILGLSIVGLLFYLGCFLTGRRAVAVIGLLVGIFWGGIGFL